MRQIAIQDLRYVLGGCGGNQQAPKMRRPPRNAAPPQATSDDGGAPLVNVQVAHGQLPSADPSSGGNLASNS